MVSFSNFSALICAYTMLMFKWIAVEVDGTYCVRVFFFGICIANPFDFVKLKFFLPVILRFLDPMFLVELLILCWKEMIYFKPSCFHFHGSLWILAIGSRTEAYGRESTFFC